MVYLAFVFSALFAYLLCSFSPAIFIGKLHKVDIRREGSCNAGTTNVLRVLGKKAALCTMVIDILKGFVSSCLGIFAANLYLSYIYPDGTSGLQSSQYVSLYAISVAIVSVAAISAVLGHVFPIYYGFKGGKGVATAFGAILRINWMVALICLLVVIVVTLISKKMSLGSICGAFACPLAFLVLDFCWMPMGCVLAIILIVKHRSNIERLLAKEEPNLSFLDKHKE
ncbi:MAG: glycerol-3-phosphate 1-O-acyltransferase PlsY [Clostridia bacterium]|nr:glycerol-3-phosphate 1-O-acyltransferase PlsY [Clostridia bacterium]